MNKTIGIVLLLVGVLLLVLGANASASFASELSRIFTGYPTDSTMWLLVGGVASLALGAGLTAIEAGGR